MRIEQRTEYICEYCQKLFTNEKDAIDCEKRHVEEMPRTILGVRGKTSQRKPEEVVIKLNNGEIWQYSAFQQLDEEAKYRPLTWSET